MVKVSFLGTGREGNQSHLTQYCPNIQPLIFEKASVWPPIHPENL